MTSAPTAVPDRDPTLSCASHRCLTRLMKVRCPLADAPEVDVVCNVRNRVDANLEGTSFIRISSVVPQASISPDDISRRPPIERQGVGSRLN